MKYKHLLILAVLTAVAFLGCKGSESGSIEGKEVLDKDTSYAIGLMIGYSNLEGMEEAGFIINTDEFLKGMTDYAKGKKTRFTIDEAEEVIEAAFNAIRDRRNAATRQEEIDFLAEIAREPGVIKTASGLQYKIITEKDGPKPTVEDTVLVHFTGQLADGQFIDNTYNSQPVPMEFYQMVPGWDEGLLLMSVGSKYRFYVPSHLALGEEGFVNWMTGEVVIPPYATLIYEVDLLEINPNIGGQ
ncbi:MAG: FKBP-type peptidyl-prolyl cis-trans isomerase [Treponema sp.]|nr:FKBP-type peptidyl-prolyl cis-trans isomerase [Treponema sp.]